MNHSCIVLGVLLVLVFAGSRAVGASPDLRAGNPSLTVECDGGPDNDGEPDPGETVFLTLPIRNFDTSAASGVSATLRVTFPREISRLEPASTSYQNHPCGNPFIHDFDLRPGEAYFFLSSTQFDFQWNTC